MGDELEDEESDSAREKPHNNDHAKSTRNRRRSRPPSEESFGNTETFYQASRYKDPYDDQRTEYLDDEHTVYDYRRSEHVDRDEQTGRLSKLDDEMATALADNLKTGADGTMDFGRTPGLEPTEDPRAQPAQLTPAESRLPTSENAETIYGADLSTAVSRRTSAANPFTPDVLPIPAAHLGPKHQAQRAETDYSRAESYDLDGVYGGYHAPSRPKTQHDPQPGAPSAGPGTPATSSLLQGSGSYLPWLKKPSVTQTQTPPVPRLPVHQRQVVSTEPGSYFPQQQPERPPPMPMMARTPVHGGGHGWDGEIPRFR